MTEFMLLGLFDNVPTVADVVDQVRDLGIEDKQVTVMSNVPYSSRFFGRKPTRLWFAPFALGGSVVGALLAFFITFITPQMSRSADGDYLLRVHCAVHHAGGVRWLPASESLPHLDPANVRRAHH